jgi:phage-related holin
MIFFSNIELKVIWSSILGYLTFLTGCEEKVLYAIIILILIDTLFGIGAAYKKKALASYNFFGLLLFKLFFYMLLVIMAFQASICGLPFIRDLILLLIATTEVISTLESASILGFKWAKKLIEKINDNVQDKLLK